MCTNRKTGRIPSFHSLYYEENCSSRKIISCHPSDLSVNYLGWRNSLKKLVCQNIWVPYKKWENCHKQQKEKIQEPTSCLQLMWGCRGSRTSGASMQTTLDFDICDCQLLNIFNFHSQCICICICKETYPSYITPCWKNKYFGFTK